MLKMSRPSSCPEKNGDDQNENHYQGAGGQEFAPNSTEQPETRVLSAFRKDTEASKVYLAGREYFGDDGQTTELRLVSKIKHQLSTDPTFRPEYPSPLGLTEFTRQATNVTLGGSLKPRLESRVLKVQTPGFNAAVRLGAELLREWFENTSWSGPVYLSVPCDGSLAGIFKAAGIHDIRQYYYWDDKLRGVCLDKLVEDLEKAPQRSVVVLSASGHYPTGVDLTENQWDVITQIVKRRMLFPFFLLPIHALCTGDLGRDSRPIQKCAALGMELICAQSFSHCFGQYGEAVGHLIYVLKDNSLLIKKQCRAREIVKSLWAQPSMMGAHIVATILSNPAHFVEWQEEIKRVVERCMLIRQLLRERLRHLGCPGIWDHLTTQQGLFSCIGLSDPQVEFLVNSKHVYLLPNGCLNVSAINGGNLEYVAESIHQATSL
ncbi:putative aspartate aminotransferase, cytoplasmic 2 isoform X2 [Boleophthalmus pectinirostris]|uniref:putative aspartate aminotransferase, cytoplasmic 2 isoform X2 n=1 Tax=Boleophthalmus pectinirostris TaxID=150288 RepID=UPI00242FA6A8|nr:putative aspartate aminotransferase, cytoplasmic 2 isoform X2 [Boleophthalmus pectinirostris]